MSPVLHRIPAESAPDVVYQGIWYYVVDVRHEFDGKATLTAVTGPKAPNAAEMVRITNALADRRAGRSASPDEDASPFTDALAKRVRES